MKVYIVATYNFEKGRSVLTEIHGIFTSRKKVQEFIDRYLSDNSFASNHCYVGEFEANEIVTERHTFHREVN